MCWNRRYGVGTLSHSAPETFGGRFDEKSDSFSFGILAYEVVSGVEAWATEGKSEQEIDDAVKSRFKFSQKKFDKKGETKEEQLDDWLDDNPIEERRPSLDLVQDGCPPALVDLVQLCWADETDARPTFEAILAMLSSVNVSAPEEAGNEGLLLAAAQHAYNHHFAKPYGPIPAGVANPGAYQMDYDAVYGVERPNHGLANGLRKAAIIKPLSVAYSERFNAHGGLTKAQFVFTAKETLAMQVAILFEVSGRDSDIGFDDDTPAYMGYHRRSCRAFKEYAASSGSGIDPTAAAIALEAIERMYMDPKTDRSRGMKRMMEICHDLELFRCYTTDKMEAKIDNMKKDIGIFAGEHFAKLAEATIRATGDRITYSHQQDPTTG